MQIIRIAAPQLTDAAIAATVRDVSMGAQATRVPATLAPMTPGFTIAQTITFTSTKQLAAKTLYDFPLTQPATWA